MLAAHFVSFQIKGKKPQRYLLLLFIYFLKEKKIMIK